MPWPPCMRRYYWVKEPLDLALLHRGHVGGSRQGHTGGGGQGRAEGGR
jgi:hypothetical protein